MTTASHSASKGMLVKRKKRGWTPIVPLLFGIAVLILGLLRYIAGGSGIGLAFSLSIGLWGLWAAWWLSADDEDKSCPDCGKLNSFEALNCRFCGCALEEMILMKIKKW
jgi:hypothetical protein